MYFLRTKQFIKEHCGGAVDGNAGCYIVKIGFDSNKQWGFYLNLAFHIEKTPL